MTGRKNRVLIRNDGSFAYESRSKDDVPLELLNITEKERFLSGEKVVIKFSRSFIFLCDDCYVACIHWRYLYLCFYGNLGFCFVTPSIHFDTCTLVFDFCIIPIP